MKIIIALAVLAVVVILGFGIMTMFQGGEDNRIRSNKLMQLRVAAQAVAIVIILIALWASGNGPS
jgi:Na+/H+ antiporter NhaC